jgi:rRNA maturation protein Nop10
MAITVKCPKGHLLQVKEKYAGQSGFCPHCSTRVDVPHPKRLSEDEILTILGPSSASPDPAEEVVHQEPLPKEQSGISLLKNLSRFWEADIK